MFIVNLLSAYIKNIIIKVLLLAVHKYFKLIKVVV